MERYKTLWLCLIAGLATVGVLTTLSTWSVPVALGSFLICAVIGGIVATARAGDLRWRAAASAGALSGIAVLGTLGLGLLLEAWVVPLMALVALCSPPGLVWLRRFAFWHADKIEAGEWKASPSSLAMTVADLPSTGTDLRLEADEPATPEAIESMDDAAVCHAWRASYVALQHPLSTASKLRVVTRRQEYLDELERRNPQGFSTWLASGARAAGDPGKYILPAERRDDTDHRH